MNTAFKIFISAIFLFSGLAHAQKGNTGMVVGTEAKTSEGTLVCPYATFYMQTKKLCSDYTRALSPQGFLNSIYGQGVAKLVRVERVYNHRIDLHVIQVHYELTE